MKCVLIDSESQSFEMEIPPVQVGQPIKVPRPVRLTAKEITEGVIYPTEGLQLKTAIYRFDPIESEARGYAVYYLDREASLR